MGVPVALLSQGIGPMKDSALRRRAAEVLPRSALIAVREGLEGPQLLAELGVPPSRVAVTGDDALALVVDAPVVAGEALGVNVRRSDYAGVGDAAVARLGALLERLAARLGAPRVALPISLHPLESDAQTARSLVDGAVEPPSSAAAVIALAARCRAVVTGSYHAGVFALGLGIPVVGLHATPYYASKFAGLAAQFPGGGCTPVDLDDPGLAQRLDLALEEARAADAGQRARWRDAARAQVAASHAAWDRLAAHVG